ncbi:hypothetical protein PHYBLDRAFT_139640 [Phycomyces blakesleeanus NRRL 1555(-)]|uniref:Uncharacterized protein n=1 Tax=Phycomyces blakesleeanus (strain ATCC 8743b / DSM 1359 / FGSC 10004 / NBRC 33097 / NRRL 1555) TaxID=763407 RepID=A0A167QF70_PHYB8|nr:hypothetical protein PHYBLDRAFT_139640 [Phycomyces blakesleeanus NRRL 1555(-)]OAD79608.1 hypothetical protein PHYBLDRAFT_139640 [Phycomyces blakesleeanus NRRL 1555(-)]|eukprot:XP_018297648.1 hypothetical protein PHYBLDRAFT_139640 [Phycomyces blakesleeanus NRRL 1555(-)]
MSSQHSTEYTRRNSLPSFVRQLLLLMSPSEQNTQSHIHTEQSSHEEKQTPSSPFEDLYFSFPAYEELDPDNNANNGCELGSSSTSSSTSSCAQHHHHHQHHRESSSAMKSSRGILNDRSYHKHATITATATATATITITINTSNSNSTNVTITATITIPTTTTTIADH